MSNYHIDLWDSFRDGNDDAFTQLFEIYSQSLYQYGFKLVNNKELVKDCIQDLFLKIHKNRSSLSATENPKFYLLFALKNIIRDNLEKNKRLLFFPQEEIHFFAEYTVSEPDDMEPEHLKMIDEIIKNLSAKQKEIIYLRFHLDLSYEEIAKILNISYQSTRNLAHRTISKIRSKLSFHVFLSIFVTLQN